MRTSNLHFLIITLACILFACKDNNDIEPDANDAFVGSQRSARKWTNSQELTLNA